MKIKNNLKRYWKQLAGVMLIVIMASWPQEFIVYNLDMGFTFIMAIGALILARVAKSAVDSWQSKPQDDKRVSVSKFMADSETDNLSKAIVHASQIIAIAIIIFAAIARS